VKFESLFINTFNKIFFSAEVKPTTPIEKVKPPREGDIWDRIGHTEPKPIVNEVFTILIIWLKTKLRRLGTPLSVLSGFTTRVQL